MSLDVYLFCPECGHTVGEHNVTHNLRNMADEAGIYFPRPRAHYGTGRNANRLKDSAPLWHDKRPDVDKLARAVLDAITESGTLRDDCQVVALSARKRYGPPGVAITLGEDL